MELLVVGAIAALGWKINSSVSQTETTTPRREQETDRSNKKARTQVQVQSQSQGDEWEGMPRRPVAFYRQRAVHTSDAIKTRKHALATGTDDVMWKPKPTEGFPQRFDPSRSRAQVSSGGVSQINLNQGEERRMPVLSSVQNGARPMQQQFIGPSSSSDPTVTASEGFHPTYRVDDDRLRGALGTYNTNAALEGRVIPGGALSGMAHGPSRTFDDPGQSAGKLLYTRAPMAGRAAGAEAMTGGGGYRAPHDKMYAGVTAAAKRGQQESVHMFGAATGPTPLGAAGLPQTERTLDRFTGATDMHVLNMSGMASGSAAPGGYVNADMNADGGRQQFLDREQLNPAYPIAGYLPGPGLGSSEAFGGALPMTIRSQMNTSRSDEAPAGPARDPYGAPPEADRVRGLERPAIGVVPSMFGREAPGRQVDNASGLMGAAGLRGDDEALNTLRHPGHACLASADGSVAPGDSGRDGKKHAESRNPRLDLNLASLQMASNPLRTC